MIPADIMARKGGITTVQSVESENSENYTSSGNIDHRNQNNKKRHKRFLSYERENKNKNSNWQRTENGMHTIELNKKTLP